MANILLEYLRRIDERKYLTGRERRESLRELSKALDEIWKIRKSNPSKALEDLEEMSKYRIEYGEYLMPIKDIGGFENLKQSLIKAQEKNDKDAAFDLIAEKNVDVKLLRWAYPSLEAYNVKVRTEKEYWWREELTMEEFQFLGRMVGAM